MNFPSRGLGLPARGGLGMSRGGLGGARGNLGMPARGAPAMPVRGGALAGRGGLAPQARGASAPSAAPPSTRPLSANEITALRRACGGRQMKHFTELLDYIIPLDDMRGLDRLDRETNDELLNVYYLADSNIAFRRAFLERYGHTNKVFDFVFFRLAVWHLTAFYETPSDGTFNETDLTSSLKIIREVVDGLHEQDVARALTAGLSRMSMYQYDKEGQVVVDTDGRARNAPGWKTGTCLVQFVKKVSKYLVRLVSKEVAKQVEETVLAIIDAVEFRAELSPPLDFADQVETFESWSKFCESQTSLDSLEKAATTTSWTPPTAPVATGAAVQLAVQNFQQSTTLTNQLRFLARQLTRTGPAAWEPLPAPARETIDEVNQQRALAHTLPRLVEVSTLRPQRVLARLPPVSAQSTAPTTLVSDLTPESPNVQQITLMHAQRFIDSLETPSKHTAAKIRALAPAPALAPALAPTLAARADAVLTADAGVNDVVRELSVFCACVHRHEPAPADRTLAQILSLPPLTSNKHYPALLARCIAANPPGAATEDLLGLAAGKGTRGLAGEVLGVASRLPRGHAERLLTILVDRIIRSESDVVVLEATDVGSVEGSELHDLCAEIALRKVEESVSEIRLTSLVAMKANKGAEILIKHLFDRSDPVQAAGYLAQAITSVSQTLSMSLINTVINNYINTSSPASQLALFMVSQPGLSTAPLVLARLADAAARPRLFHLLPGPAFSLDIEALNGLPAEAVKHVLEAHGGMESQIAICKEIFRSYVILRADWAEHASLAVVQVLEEGAGARGRKVWVNTVNETRSYISTTADDISGVTSTISRLLYLNDKIVSKLKLPKNFRAMQFFAAAAAAVCAAASERPPVALIPCLEHQPSGPAGRRVVDLIHPLLQVLDSVAPLKTARGSKFMFRPVSTSHQNLVSPFNVSQTTVVGIFFNPSEAIWFTANDKLQLPGGAVADDQDTFEVLTKALHAQLGIKNSEVTVAGLVCRLVNLDGVWKVSEELPTASETVLEFYALVPNNGLLTVNYDNYNYRCIQDPAPRASANPLKRVMELVAEIIKKL